MADNVEDNVAFTRTVSQFDDTPNNVAIFSANFSRELPVEIRKLHCNRAFLLISSTLNTSLNGLFNQTLGNLLVGKKVGVKPYTTYTDVLDLVDKLHKSRADIIVSVGGSSYTDAAKIAMIVHSSLKYSDLSVSAMDTLVSQTPESWEIVSPPGLKVPVLKLIVIPTTLSAAEYNTGGGATHPETHKKVIFEHPLCATKCIILDPQLCRMTPKHLWLSTGMRAVDHCVEALCTELCASDVEKKAEEGLCSLVPGLLACRKDHTDIAAISACHNGAWKAMHAVHYKIPFGASHAIGHHLGGVESVPHGETSSVMLPAVMKYNKEVNSARQEKVAEIIWRVAGKTFENNSLTRETADAGDLIKSLAKFLGLPTTLGELGVTESQLDRIAEYTLRDIWGKTNPRSLYTRDQVLDILRMAT